MTRVMLAAIVLLIAALYIEGVRGSRARAAAVQAALVRDSLEASTDTTREITREVQDGVLRDSVRVFVIQLRLSCRGAKGTPVRQAFVVAVAPRWARAVIGDVEQSGGVYSGACGSECAGAGGCCVQARRRMVGVGIVPNADGQVVARPALVVGVSGGRSFRTSGRSQLERVLTMHLHARMDRG